MTNSTERKKKWESRYVIKIEWEVEKVLSYGCKNYMTASSSKYQRRIQSVERDCKQTQQA